MEVEARIITAILFNAADKDGNGRLSFEEYFNNRVRAGAVTQEMRAKLEQEFRDIDKDKNGELDFEEVVEFFVGDSSKIEVHQHQISNEIESASTEQPTM
jgi:Ca2+-binding EF-hand superfamily protein